MYLFSIFLFFFASLTFHDYFHSSQRLYSFLSLLSLPKFIRYFFKFCMLYVIKLHREIPDFAGEKTLIKESDR